MSEERFERSVVVRAPVALVRRFFADGETWFRLNPEWEVLACAADRLKVRYERSEAEAEYRRPAGADFGDAGTTLLLDGASARTLQLGWTAAGEGLTRIDYGESFAAPLEDARRAELNLWLDAAAGYLTIAARGDRRARLMRWLLDRFWLRMSPSARRVGLLIVGMETMALLLFIAVLLVYRIAG